MNPLKQGLKHGVNYFVKDEFKRIKEVNPLKQGLKQGLS